MNEKSPHTLPVHFPGSEHKINVTSHFGLCQMVDDILQQLYKESGIKVSRNTFILKAIKHFLDHLMSCDDVNVMINEIKKVRIGK